jgi:hypothetical protein
MITSIFLLILVLISILCLVSNIHTMEIIGFIIGILFLVLDLLFIIF